LLGVLLCLLLLQQPVLLVLLFVALLLPRLYRSSPPLLPLTLLLVRA
jgi:hypothetical protein